MKVVVGYVCPDRDGDTIFYVWCQYLKVCYLCSCATSAIYEDKRHADWAHAQSIATSKGFDCSSPLDSGNKRKPFIRKVE